MLSFCAINSDTMVGTEGLVELSWYEDVFPLKKREKIILKFYFAPLGSSIRVCMLLKGEGFSNYDRGKTA